MNEQRTFTGRHMLACMLSFFGVIIAVNFTMAWMAGNTWTGLVVKNSYVASQKFNGQLLRARDQNKRGWRSRLTYTDGLFAFELLNKSGVTIQLNTPELTIGRPAFEQQDRTMILQALDDGTYGATRNLAPGVWAIRITGTTANGPYRRDSRIFVSTKKEKKQDG